jgi:glutaredoxin-like protein
MFENREGQRVPLTTFKTRQDDRWVELGSDDLFKGKTVVCFALPGAFTPTCSSSHLPRYEELTPILKANGVDEVVCLSVNDAFVMEQWGRDQGVKHVRVLPDGNGHFTAGMGMLVDKEDLGFGKRSWRYSMLVRDGVIEKMFIEPSKPGDPFEVSDADTMLSYLNPNAEKPQAITLFTKKGCPHCARVKALLTSKGKEFDELVLGEDVSQRMFRAVTGASTVPQVFVDGKHIGSADDLEAYLAA